MENSSYLKKQVEANIEDILSVLEYEKFGLDKNRAKIMSNGFVKNIRDNLEEFFNS